MLYLCKFPPRISLFPMSNYSFKTAPTINASWIDFLSYTTLATHVRFKQNSLFMDEMQQGKIWWKKERVWGEKSWLLSETCVENLFVIRLQLDFNFENHIRPLEHLWQPMKWQIVNWFILVVVVVFTLWIIKSLIITLYDKS